MHYFSLLKTFFMLKHSISCNSDHFFQIRARKMASSPAKVPGRQLPKAETTNDTGFHKTCNIIF